MTCPICGESVPQALSETNHWNGHLTNTSSGDFTWACVCGPAGMSWTSRSHAGMALGVHMVDNHGFRMF